jgi:hypothetical protein
MPEDAEVRSFRREKSRSRVEKIPPTAPVTPRDSRNRQPKVTVGSALMLPSGDVDSRVVSVCHDDSHKSNGKTIG